MRWCTNRRDNTEPQIVGSAAGMWICTVFLGWLCAATSRSVHVSTVDSVRTSNLFTFLRLALCRTSHLYVHVFRCISEEGTPVCARFALPVCSRQIICTRFGLRVCTRYQVNDCHKFPEPSLYTSNYYNIKIDSFRTLCAPAN